MTHAPIRVGIVDDHPSITWGLERLIASESPRMIYAGLAHDLPGARALLTGQKPDIVLLDLDLGGADGGQLIKEFAGGTTRFVILTGLRDPQLRRSAMMAGAQGIVGKNEQPETILRAIVRVHAGELWLDRVETGEFVSRPRRQPQKQENNPFESLTNREREIVETAVELSGAPNKRLAELLGIGENTLRNALTTIYSKTGASNRVQLFAMASRHMVPPRARLN